MEKTLILSLVLVIFLAVPAIAVEFKAGNLEIENEYIKNDNGESSSETVLKLGLFLNQKIDERASLFVFTKLHADFNQAEGNTEGTDVFIRKGWLDVEDAIGPVDLRVGRMDELTANNLLYSMKVKYEFARLAYNNKIIAIKAGHNIDADEKTVFTELKLKDLALLDTVTLNYVNADFSVIDYNGYSINFLKNFAKFTTELTYLDVENGELEPNAFDLRLSTDKLFPKTKLFFEYANVEMGVVVNKHKFQDDSILAESTLNQSDDLKMFRPGFNVDFSDRLNIDFSYAIYEADNSDARDNYLDLIFNYDLTKNTYCELEYEDHSYDDNAGTDESIITTSLGVNF
ncbi:porin [Halocella sp. SP3-1]|uniref:porin n=1 Tax=Halocella sp. SP3-1 TaxID=2382161 RepID=UPI0013DFDA8C|nr:porin [Halocella sp. SP3-1]